MRLSSRLIKQIQRLKRQRTFVSRNGYTVKIQMQVDARRLKQSIDSWDDRVLFKTGGFIRKLIQASMRSGNKQKRNRRYRPRPPYRWEGLLAKLVLFDVDKSKSTVSWGVGRVKTSSSARKGIPRVLEEGGTARIEVIRGNRDDFFFEKVKAKYRKHPYIAPQKQNAVNFMRQKLKESELGEA